MKTVRAMAKCFLEFGASLDSPPSEKRALARWKVANRAFRSLKGVAYTNAQLRSIEAMRFSVVFDNHPDEQPISVTMCTCTRFAKCIRELVLRRSNIFANVPVEDLYFKFGAIEINAHQIPEEIWPLGIDDPILRLCVRGDEETEPEEV